MRLARKELRETLRDRRTTVTLILMPILVYPLLSLTFSRLVGPVGGQEDMTTEIGVRSDAGPERFREMLHWAGMSMGRAGVLDREEAKRWRRLRFKQVADPQEAVRGYEVAVAVDVAGSPDGENRVVLYYRDEHPTSLSAVRLVERRLAWLNQMALAGQAKRQGARVRPVIRWKPIAVVPAESTTESLGMMLPLILVLMTITGAVYPAIDLTAGERERGTLETLIAAPIPRYQLLLAKYVAVLTVTLLTAVVNLTAMVFTLIASGLAPILFGDYVPSPEIVALILGLTLLFGMFFAAVLLTVTSFARSFKEAQAYLIPLMLLAVSPGVLAMMPTIELGGVLLFVPLVNVVLLARDLLREPVPFEMVLLVVGVTSIYTVAALAVAARVFGTDAVGETAEVTLGDWLRRPKTRLHEPSSNVAAAGMAGAFILFFVLGRSIALAQPSLRVGLWLNAAASIVTFGLFPIAVAGWRHVAIRPTFALARPPLAALVPCLLLAASLWPLAHELVLLGQWLVPMDPHLLELVRRHVEELNRQPLPLVLMGLALVPAVVEEIFFRGIVLSGMGVRQDPRRAILWSAVAFGAFHVLTPSMLLPERFLGTTFLGLMLAWVRVRTGSLFPGMLVHAVHNGLLLVAARHQDHLTWLVPGGGRPGELPHFPVWLIACSLLVVAASAAWLTAVTRKRTAPGTQASPPNAD